MNNTSIVVTVLVQVLQKFSRLFLNLVLIILNQSLHSILRIVIELHQEIISLDFLYRVLIYVESLHEFGLFPI